jgi:alkylation response protein AidB-like acyl-CoA dehydrogenase
MAARRLDREHLLDLCACPAGAPQRIRGIWTATSLRVIIINIMSVVIQPAAAAAAAWAGPSGAREQEFRAAVRTWIAENLSAEWASRSAGAGDQSHLEHRLEFGRLLGEAGWLSMTWPKAVGGLGLGATCRLILLEEMIAAGAPEPMNTNVLGIFAPTLIKFGTPEQCAWFLPGMVNHRSIWCQGFSEPGAGSDLAAISTRGRVEGDEIVVTGQKVWTSYANLAEYCYLLLRTTSGSVRHAGLSLVVLPMRQAGVDVRPLKNIAGTEEFCEVFLDGARVPLANVIGELGDGWRMAMYALGQERSVGLAQRSLRLNGEFQRLAEMTRSARATGNPRASDAFVSGALVDAFVRSTVVAATVRRAIQLDAQGIDIGPLSSVAKVFWSESHQPQMGLIAELLGPDFVVDEPPGSDWYQAAMYSRGETIYGGTSQIQRNVLARSLGLPKGR